MAEGQLFPFEGLHVYQKAKEAALFAGRAASRNKNAPSWQAVHAHLRTAVLEIAGATALDSEGRLAELREARGNVMQAAARIDMLRPSGENGAHEGEPWGVPELLTIMHDLNRTLGALVRSLTPDEEGR